MTDVGSAEPQPLAARLARRKRADHAILESLVGGGRPATGEEIHRKKPAKRRRSAGSKAARVVEDAQIEKGRRRRTKKGPARQGTALPREFADDSTLFSAKRPPQEGDYLDINPDDPGQSFEEYLQDAPQLLTPYRPDARRRTIYLQPIGNFPAGRSPDLAFLAELCRAFFHGMAVTLSPAWRIIKQKGASALETPDGFFDVRHRRAPDGRHGQLCLNDLADGLLWKQPADAWCVMGVTLHDLYEEEEDIFCMGRAWGGSRAGLFSFLRYDPRFKPGAGPCSQTRDRCLAMTYRAAKTLTHELGHCFLLDHCITHECLMNGTANMREDDEAPAHLCPTDLRKLQHACQFDVCARYQALLAVYQDQSCFKDELTFLRRRLATLAG